MKKQRRKRRIVRRKFVAVHDNRHHIFWPRKMWNKGKWSHALRTHQFCIIELPVGIHNEIHDAITCVMLPNEAVCERAVHVLDELWSFGAIGKDTPVVLRLNILVCILDGVASGTAYSLKQQRKILDKLNNLNKPH